MPAAAGTETNRIIYPFAGTTVSIDGEIVEAGTGALVEADRPVELIAGPDDGSGSGIECIVLQGRPIGEPVARYGPFVMNTDAEIRQAFDDYRATQFGGWPWPTDDPSHRPELGRFAVHADGRIESFDDERAVGAASE
jgi:hypothetical protein